MLYEIMLNALRSTLDLENPKSNPHIDGIVDFAQSKAVDLATIQMKKLTIHQLAAGPATHSTTPATEPSNVHSVQTKTSKGPPQPINKRKGKGKKCGGGNNKKLDKNAKGEKDEKRKVKFPCKSCDDDHLTHQFPWMEEA